MTKFQALFQRDKELHQQWAAVCHTDYFEKVLLYATGIVGEGNVTTEHLEGAKKFKEALLTMADNDEVSVEEPASGLEHDVLARVKQDREQNKAK